VIAAEVADRGHAMPPPIPDCVMDHGDIINNYNHQFGDLDVNLDEEDAPEAALIGYSRVNAIGDVQDSVEEV